MQHAEPDAKRRRFGRGVIVTGLVLAAILIAIFVNRGPHAPAWAPIPMHRVAPPANAAS